jgi:hypothetical protein
MKFTGSLGASTRYEKGGERRCDSSIFDAFSGIFGAGTIGWLTLLPLSTFLSGLWRLRRELLFMSCTFPMAAMQQGAAICRLLRSKPLAAFVDCV